ncbi:MAG: D-lysine 5,6-aminomutase subunit alpha [Deltaproteobacteria bacterium]|nr:D-lysine 5,6-aminomutase subunit alpha [Deltaproteobacteria bacterium]
MVKLNLDREVTDRCREYADSIVHPVLVYINRHSTVSIERAVLRLLGFSGGYERNGAVFPVPNLIVDKVGRKALKDGIAGVVAQIKKRYPRWNQQKIAEKIIKGEVDLERLEDIPHEKMREIIKPWIDSAIRQIDRMRHKKEEKRYKFGNRHPPLKSVEVGSGHVYEDVDYAEMAVRQGADIITVNRSTAQSLLDYVPEGVTTEGFGGTFATQENLRLMSERINRLSYELGRYVSLGHCSLGLCMPELAVIGAAEGLDYLVNDPLSSILFRDINPKRAVIDQHFSRMVIARAGMILHTGEENIFKMTGTHLNHHQVMASQFINECLARRAGVRDDQIGLSHACEIDPQIEDSIVLEMARAELTREVFFRNPIKYMPPTRCKQDDAAYADTLDAMFNLTGIMTGQNIQCLGDNAQVFSSLATVHDRHHALKNAAYIFDGCRSVLDELIFSSNGKVMRQARQILDNSHKLLKRISEKSFFGALEEGLIVDRPRSRDGGRGYQGVFEKSRQYYNPFLELTAPTHARR